MKQLYKITFEGLMEDKLIDFISARNEHQALRKFKRNRIYYQIFSIEKYNLYKEPEYPDDALVCAR